MGQIEKVSISEDTSKIFSLRQSYFFKVCFKLFFLCRFVHFFSAKKDPFRPTKLSLGVKKATVTSTDPTGVFWGLME